MNLWTFGNDFARNVVIFGVDDSSSSRSDNRKNNFLILGDINDSFGSLEKKYQFSTSFTKANIKICLSSHCHHDNSYLFINGQESFKFKADDKSVDFPTQFCLGSISNKFGNIDSREVYLEVYVYGF